MTKEKIKKPKCKGSWRLVKYCGVWCYQCSWCGARLTPRQGSNAINHKDEKG